MMKNTYGVPRLWRQKQRKKRKTAGHVKMQEFIYPESV